MRIKDVREIEDIQSITVGEMVKVLDPWPPEAIIRFSVSKGDLNQADVFSVRISWSPDESIS